MCDPQHQQQLQRPEKSKSDFRRTSPVDINLTLGLFSNAAPFNVVVDGSDASSWGRIGVAHLQH
jgi:hypothetical protein